MNIPLQLLKDMARLVRGSSKEPEQLFRLIRFTLEHHDDLQLLLNFFDALVDALQKRGCAYPTLEIEIDCAIGKDGAVALGVDFFPTELLSLKRSDYFMGAAWIGPGRIVTTRKGPGIDPDECMLDGGLLSSTIGDLVANSLKHFFDS